MKAMRRMKYKYIYPHVLITNIIEMSFIFNNMMNFLHAHNSLITFLCNDLLFKSLMPFEGIFSSLFSNPEKGAIPTTWSDQDEFHSVVYFLAHILD